MKNRFNYQQLLLAACLCAYLLPVWAQQNMALNVPIQQYDGGQSAALQKLRQLQRGEAVKFRVVQLGDSHTAGGFLTDQLRSRLQQQWGNGGLGVFYPNQIKYQRISGVTFPKNHWQLLTSRVDIGDFPLGGVLTRSLDGALTIEPRSLGMQSVSVMAKPVFAQNTLQIIDANQQIKSIPSDQYGWQHIHFQATMPMSIHATRGDLWEIGLIQLENQSDKGVLVSALGINGAQWSHWQKWRAGWQQDLAATQADLVILAYGTNEAFQAALNLAETETFWRNQIAEIRQTLPESAILLLGAPESLTQTTGECGTRAPRLDDVQAMQQRVAQQTGVWYWSWQDAMGGRCSMNRWRQQGLASKDGIHFTADGYTRAGNLLAQAVMALTE